MKALPLLFPMVLALWAAEPSSAVAQEPPRTGQLYVADVVGIVSVIVEDRIIELKAGDSIPAEGSVIETSPDSNVSLIFSNGTALFLEQNGKLEIRRFAQEFFASTLTVDGSEPSISHTNVNVIRGQVVLNTPNLASGTTMAYHTPHSIINIRGQLVHFDVKPEQTKVYVLNGNVTVRAGDMDPVGSVVWTGQQAIVAANAQGSVEVSAARPESVDNLEQKVTKTEQAKATVFFQTPQTLAGSPGESPDTPPEAKRVVPVVLPVEMVVSPSSIPNE